MLHVIAQKFGHQHKPVFLSGMPGVRGCLIGQRTRHDIKGRESAATRGGTALDEQPLATERAYSDYEIAYQTGYEGFMRHGENAGSFDAAEPALREEYEHRLPASEAERPQGTATALAAAQAHLLWDQARHAARTAWKRAARQLSPRGGYRPAA